MSNKQMMSDYDRMSQAAIRADKLHDLLERVDSEDVVNFDYDIALVTGGSYGELADALNSVCDDYEL